VNYVDFKKHGATIQKKKYSMVLDSKVSSCHIATFHFSTVIMLRILVF